MPSKPTDDKFIVRMPDGMRDRIAKVAKRNHRTMNAEVVSRLDASFTPPKAVEPILPHTTYVKEMFLMDQRTGKIVELVYVHRDIDTGELLARATDVNSGKTKNYWLSNLTTDLTSRRPQEIDDAF